MKFAQMSLPTRGWEEKMCGFCRFSLRNSFAVQGPCLCRRGKLVFAVSVFFTFAVSAAILHCFRSLLGQLTPMTNTRQTKLILIKGGKVGSASRLDSSLFEEG